LISDYGKGVCTPGLLQWTIAAARRLGKPVLVDPLRGGDYARYRGATLLKPNRAETSLATGRAIVAAADALSAAEALCNSLDLSMAVVTLDRDGMAFYQRESGSEWISTDARAVYDITGAGDMVLAALGVFLASGAAPADALRLANIAAGLEVEQVGVVVVTRDEIRSRLLRQLGTVAKIVDRDTAARLAETYRRQGQRVAFTNGCFDLLHAGHVMSLSAARQAGDVLFVGVNCDQVIRQLKGPQRPIIGEQERMAVLAALACVDHVVLFSEATPHALLRAIRPDVLVKGGTYAPEEVVGREVVESYGGTIRVTPVVEGLSTTNIVEAVRRSA
jgi:D-beta-D-heptose 7-phosphate kinase / D-beta-D-heptose 1-phosphate adenosyltransferase